MTTLQQIECPTCGHNNTWQSDNPFKPFCSQRCKLIDFGDWACESHKIAGDQILDIDDNLIDDTH